MATYDSHSPASKTHVDLLLGIDGGGSKTRVLLADPSGVVLGTGTTGSSNYQSVGVDSATKTIKAAIDAAFRAADLPAGPVGAACLGLAGVDRPEDKFVFEVWLAQQQLAEHHTIVNDAELVLAAGTPEGWGLALICGTGSICHGRGPDGHSARAGGWGAILGDEGSGYDIAIRALRLATQTADGRAEAHTLLRATLDHWGLQQPEELVGRIYTSEMARAEIATLARQVVALAEAEDSFAISILDEAARELSRLIETVARRLNLHQPPIAFAGGLLGSSKLLGRRTIECTSIALGPSTYVREPAHGGVILARQLLEEKRS